MFTSDVRAVQNVCKSIERITYNNAQVLISNFHLKFSRIWPALILYVVSDGGTSQMALGRTSAAE